MVNTHDTLPVGKHIVCITDDLLSVRQLIDQSKIATSHF